MARNVPRPNETSSGVAGAAAVRFRFHVLDEHAVSHGIPYRVGPAIGVPGEHDGDVADSADSVVAVASGGVPERPAHGARQCMSCRIRPKPCRGWLHRA